MLLELHSQINIFTQKKKGINNLWKKSLQIQSSYDSALILSFHCTSLSIFLSQPHPACLSQKGTSNCQAESGCHAMSFRKGKGTIARWHLEALPHSTWGLEITPRPAFFPVGTSLCENKTAVTWTLGCFCSLKNGPLISHIFLNRPGIASIYGEGPALKSIYLPAVVGGFLFWFGSPALQIRESQRTMFGQHFVTLIWTVAQHMGFV